MSVRHWLGEAIAAHDESLARLPEGDFGDPGFWLQRAQVAATIASAEQARIGNLIAWKQLRQTASSTALGNSGDAISDEIEEVLGLVGAGDDPLAAVRGELATLHGVDLSTTEGTLAAVEVLERVAVLAGYLDPSTNEPVDEAAREPAEEPAP